MWYKQQDLPNWKLIYFICVIIIHSRVKINTWILRKAGEDDMPTPIIVRVNDVVIPAMLNDTVASLEFKKRLPFKVSGHRYKVDYCCATACGIFDPTETQCGWENGDISLAGGWFSIFFDGEETSKSHHGMMIIGHIEQQHLQLIKGLPVSVKFVVVLDNENKEKGINDGNSDLKR